MGNVSLTICAVLVIASLFGCGGQTPEELFQKGYRSLQEGDSIGAALYFDKFIKKYPENEYAVKAHYMLAQCRVQIGDYELAMKELKLITRQFSDQPEAIDAGFMIADFYSQNRQPEQAEEALKQVISNTDKKEIKIPAMFMMAKSYAFSATQPEKVDRILTEAIQLADDEGTRMQALFEIASAYIVSGSYLKAIESYDALIASASLPEEHRARAALFKGKCYRETGDEEHALQSLDELRKDFSSSDTAIWSCIESADLLRTTDPQQSTILVDKALKSYGEIIDESPTSGRSIWARFKIAESQNLIGDVTAALESYTAIAEDFPESKDDVLRAKEMMSRLQRKLNEIEHVPETEDATQEISVN